MYIQRDALCIFAGADVRRRLTLDIVFIAVAEASFATFGAAVGLKS